MSFFRTIKFRLTMWYVVVMVLVAFVLGSMAYFLLSHSLYNNLDDSMTRRAVEMETALVESQTTSSLVGGGGEMVWLYTPDGALLKKSGARGEVPGIGALLAQATAEDNVHVTRAIVDGEEVRVLVSLFNAGPGNRELLVLARSTAAIEDFLAKLRFLTVVSGLAIVAYVAVFGMFRTSRALGPVGRMAADAQEIGEADLSRRMNVSTNDELGGLATTLNRMIERLEAAFKRQRQFTADASHELRTPLAVIRAESTLALSRERTEADYRKSLDLISQEAGHMSAMIEELLFLARSDSGEEKLEKKPIDLKQLLGEASREMEVLCAEKGLDFREEMPEGLTVEGDPAKLRRLFVNLLHNAVRYTAEGGVALSGSKEDGLAVVKVTDTGIGIGPEHVPHIFERFYRADKARSRADGGSGLGLAIAREIATLHGGEIDVESQVGGGSSFRVRLPLAKSGPQTAA